MQKSAARGELDRVQSGEINIQGPDGNKAFEILEQIRFINDIVKELKIGDKELENIKSTLRRSGGYKDLADLVKTERKEIEDYEKAKEALKSGAVFSGAVQFAKEGLAFDQEQLRFLSSDKQF